MIDIKELKEKVKNINNNIEYIEEFGYAKSYPADNIQVKEEYENLILYLNKCETILDTIADICCENFGY